MTTDISKPTPEIKRSDWWVTENLRTTPERTKSVNRLLDMLTYKRPAFSKTDRNFIKKFIKPIKGIKEDAYGNLWVRCGKLPFLWASHTDTVHESKGVQLIGFDKNEVGVAAEDKSGSSCLGADDTTGVWLMLEMLDAGVPGLYIFHRAEEGGRKGSKYILEHNKSLLQGSLFAIALDRRNDDSIITHQMSDRCCSDDWANQLATLLNVDGLKYKTDKTGSYTDTATYVDVIGECTNLSVGYTAAHSKWERQDLEFVFKLRDVLCSPAFIEGMAKLEPKRKPGEKESRTYYGGSGYNGSYNGSHNMHGGTAHNAVRRGVYDSETEFWEEWERSGGTMAGSNGYRSYTADNATKHHSHTNLWTPPEHRGGTRSGTQVGTGINSAGAGKIINIRANGPNEANPDGSPVIMLPDLTIKRDEVSEIVGNTLPPPSDDDDEGSHDTNYERLIQLVKRNPEATLEFLSHLVDESPDVIADILDAEGLTSKNFIDELLALGSVVNC